MISELKRHGALIEEKFPGIYYVAGASLFATQIVVTGRLHGENHSSLRILSRHAGKEDIRRFLEETEQLKTPGDSQNIDAILQVSISANGGIYEKMKEESSMCEALERLMQKEINEKVEEGRKEGREEGRCMNQIGLIKRKMEKNLSADKIADMLETEVDEVRGFMELLKKHPDASEKKIYRLWISQR
jgi:predicted transposase/invertase (TIGR01784 family)